MRPLLVLAFTVVSVKQANLFREPPAGLELRCQAVAADGPQFLANVSPAIFQQAVSNRQANLTTLTDAEFFVNSRS
jgi:hypothetical protein